MERGSASVPDWRDAAAYAPLRAADRTILAWEWLRRDPEYHTAVHSNSGGTGAHLWGLHRFEDPDLTAPAARPLWTADACDGVLTAAARASAHSGAATGTTARPPVALCVTVPSGPRGDGIDIRALSRWLTVFASERREHLLFSEGLRVIRCDLLGASVYDGPLELAFVLPGPPCLGAPLAALRAFEGLARTGRFGSGLHPPVARARRQVLLLRTADALAAGADQRTVAAALLDPSAARPGWRDDRPHLRQQAQRLVRDARALSAGGYRKLLRAQ